MIFFLVKKKRSPCLLPAFEFSLNTWACSSSFVHMRQGSGGGDVDVQRMAAEKGGVVGILDDSAGWLDQCLPPDFLK